MAITSIILLLRVLFVPFFCLVETPDKGEVAFQYLTNDSILLDIYKVDNPAGYRAHILSPVCEEGLCYKADLEFYWDLLGDFSHFKIDPDKPLTKLDHIPFTQADYDRLNRILLTQSPSFIHLSRDELVTPPANTNAQDVDGMTGATVKAVKKDMVEGAIYTCYTLWHIANGGITFAIQEHTKQQLDENLIRKLIHTPQAKVQYFLLENMEAAYFKVFLPEIIAQAREYDAFFMARLLEKLPGALFAETIVQDFFLQHFARLESAAQQQLIDRLEPVGNLGQAAFGLLTGYLQPHRTAVNDLIIGLICRKSEIAGTEVLKKLYDTLNEAQINVSPTSLELLLALGEKHSALKKRAKRLSRTN